MVNNVPLISGSKIKMKWKETIIKKRGKSLIIWFVKEKE